jgi:bifunctional non-homologous end joining protein LigD
MLATLGDLPGGLEWAYEVKWDGVRALARIDREAPELLLTSRNGNDITSRYPELADLADAFPDAALPLLIDGEVVAFDEHGRPDFGLLQHRMHLTDAARADALAADRPVSFAVFDVLVEGGEALTALSWTERRERLEALGIEADHASVPSAYDDGEALLHEMIERGMEGVVAKRRASKYRAGKRGRDWIKVKPKPRQEFVIGGWTEGAGRRRGTVGALLLGYYADGEFTYAGNVGSGFSDTDLAQLDVLLDDLARVRNPFREDVPGALNHFVAPQLVAEIEFAELTTDGHLRQPVYKGLRDDKPAKNVTLERKI